MACDTSAATEVMIDDPPSPAGAPAERDPLRDVGQGVVRGRWQPLAGPVVTARPRVQRWRRCFAGTSEQVVAARDFVAFLLADSPVAGDAGWVAGELATNAVAHSRSGRPGGRFVVEVLRWRCSAEVRVIDAGGGGEPAPPLADPVRAALEEGGELPESGLGLYGVGALATRYGTYRLADGQRVVWARLDAPGPIVIGAENGADA